MSAAPLSQDEWKGELNLLNSKTGPKEKMVGSGGAGSVDSVIQGDKYCCMASFCCHGSGAEVFFGLHRI